MRKKLETFTTLSPRNYLLNPVKLLFDPFFGHKLASNVAAKLTMLARVALIWRQRQSQTHASGQG
jgi:hypothetical protein